MSKLIWISLLIILYSCKQDKKKSNLNGFDISSDGKSIVFSYKQDSLYSIYNKSINNGKSHVIFKGSGNYVNPKYVDNGKTIVALYYPSDKVSPEFHFYDVNTDKVIEKIKVDDGFISDYTFSNDKKIFYLQAKSFQSYSPVTPKTYHDFDVYQLDLFTLKSKKISNLNSYSMTEILNLGQDILLISQQGESSESGLFLFNTKSSGYESNLLNKIIIDNDTLRNSTMYSNPVLLPSKNILCASSYQLVMLDLSKKEEYPIFPSTGYHYSTIRNIKNLIFYKQNDGTNNIYYFNLNEKKIKSINAVPY
ncbi:hypothetical protein [Chryseobacterium taichungense]|uniref:hypothetical protein n=1 Tax=Chryseobacterium taichungense TaxID=295069 RepID=UPI0028B06616|nr:hypothetical protein [Chryseobacterium taichungense]